MGRRKIEIQPIQHDRNRSVTFLKRKNGLFKKAYELGVLCSADVAVIVFGHNHKLYEYCSTDINLLLARQREYSGDRDTKGPNDYSADKGDGGDDDSDSGGEIPVPRAKGGQSKPKGKGTAASAGEPPSATETRFAVPPPMPEPERAPSRPIKREELPPIITAVGASATPASGSMQHPSVHSSSSGSMRWQNNSAFPAQGRSGGHMGSSQPFDQSGGDWRPSGGMDRRPSWSAGMSMSAVSGPSSPLNPYYQPAISQPPVSRPVNLMTPSHTHPAPLNEILAAHPHLAQQLQSTATPSNPGFGGDPALHGLYSNPLFQQMGSQGTPASTGQSLDMDWQMSRSMPPLPPQNQSFGSDSRSSSQQFPPQQSNSMSSSDYSWLEMLGGGDSRGRSEPWPGGDGGERGAHPKASTPLGFTPVFQPPSLKRPLSSTTPISPPETGTPNQDREDELEAEDSLGILEGDLGQGGKRARIQ